MKSSTHLLKWIFLPFLILTISHLSKAKGSKTTIPPSHGLDHLLNKLSEWRRHHKESLHGEAAVHGCHTIAAVALSSLAAVISSAGGVGGGPLFLPILNLVAGLDMKTAASFSSFMVTGVFLSNVLYYLFFPSLITSSASAGGRRFLIDYDMALLSQPCMLLGVSIGVICNIMFPEWLITVLFAVFLVYSTYNTCKAGVKHWNVETEEAMRRSEACLLERGGGVEGENAAMDRQPLLDAGDAIGMRMLPKDIVVLVLVWIFFFFLHVLIGDKHGKGMINVKPCGALYWLISFSQVPFAIVVTIYILYDKRNTRVQNYQELEGKEIAAKTKIKASPMLVFPFAALITGALGGLFGVGGGLLLNPLLLQIGVPPQTASATSSFMLLFSATMTMIQYIILGMKEIEQASIYAFFCFGASAVGLVIIQGAVSRSGRASITIFAVTIVMILSAVVITVSGAFNIWAQYTSGEYMGFRPPC